MDDALEYVTDGVLVVDGEWHVTRANAVAAASLHHDVSELTGLDVRDVFPRSVDSRFHESVADADSEPIATDFEDYFPDIGKWFEVRTVPVDGGMIVVFHDVTGRKELEDSITDREAELDRLTRINATIQEIIRELVGATTREEIERTVCERLAASDLYEFTWIGERDLLTDHLIHRSAAGEYEGVVELLVDESGASDAPESLEQAVTRTGETRLVRQLVEDESVPEPVRRVAFARGLQSAIAVPVRYGTTTYGVLGVYAARANAFTERERKSLATLGVATGFVINAARQRNLLLSDTVVELTFRLTDSADALLAASSRLASSLAVEGIVPLAEGVLRCFVSVDGVPPGNLLETVSDSTGIGDARVVREATADEATDGGLLELTVTEESPLLTLVEYGATVRTATYTEGVGRVVAELAPDEDVRAVVEAVGDRFPDSNLLAKRERERDVETAQEFRSSLYERLTDRQQTALRVAYHGGYFKSPRDSTAEELAEGLGISSPTLHYHLRAAQWKLVDAFITDDPGRPLRDERDGWHGGQGVDR
ncbi:bacterio-opsin activator domain-containing protein [Salinigranum halophilum]|uniref:bacterio-opsin activator domain-containing protein n=1 Tax=Salinigranum halophilum TaxID=2565931 RepID=UPI0010A906DC|nr:bacterio-opsin activator domain-containing protein [Salinigranum halophilum]